MDEQVGTNKDEVSILQELTIILGEGYEIESHQCKKQQRKHCRYGWSTPGPLLPCP